MVKMNARQYDTLSAKLNSGWNAGTYDTKTYRYHANSDGIYRVRKEDLGRTSAKLEKVVRK